jgi:uncharacterized damage-inducible protein DinB
MLDHLRDLTAHSEWANAVFFHTWGKSPARDNDEMRKRMEHVAGVQMGFLGVLRGDVVGRPSEGSPPSFDELKKQTHDGHKGLRAFVSALDVSGMSRSVRIPWFPEPPCMITVPEALVQAAMHTQHHRGQLMTRLKDFGGEPKNVDWIIWLWKSRPEARWS